MKKNLNSELLNKTFKTKLSSTKTFKDNYDEEWD